MQLIPPNHLLMNPLDAPGLLKPGSKAYDGKIQEQVDEFAGVIFSQLVREMREAGQSEEGEGIFGGGNTNMFMHLFDQQVGRALAEQGAGGLKDALYDQLSSTLRAQQAKGDSQ